MKPVTEPNVSWQEMQDKVTLGEKRSSSNNYGIRNEYWEKLIHKSQ